MGLKGTLAMLLMAAAISAENQDPSKAGDCPEYDRVTYAPPRTDWTGTIAVERAASGESGRAAGIDPHSSPHGTASYSVKEPDTSKPGPWTTTIHVSGNKARPIELAIRITNHTSGGVRAQWLNEKLLWLQVWRGRIVSTDSILDIDSGRFIWQQDANYNSLIVPCAMKAKGAKERTP